MTHPRPRRWRRRVCGSSREFALIVLELVARRALFAVAVHVARSAAVGLPALVAAVALAGAGCARPVLLAERVAGRSITRLEGNYNTIRGQVN